MELDELRSVIVVYSKPAEFALQDDQEEDEEEEEEIENRSWVKDLERRR